MPKTAFRMKLIRAELSELPRVSPSYPLASVDTEELYLGGRSFPGNRVGAEHLRPILHLFLNAERFHGPEERFRWTPFSFMNTRR